MKNTILLTSLCLVILASKGQQVKENNSEENFKKQRETEFRAMRDPETNTIRYDLIYKALEKRAEMKNYKTRTGPTLKWNELGPKDVAGRVSELAFTKGTFRPFAGGDMGGVWSNPGISSNFSWEKKTPDIFSYYNISSIATHPNNASIIYFATGKTFGNITDKPGDGILKSINGGLTWHVVNITKPANCLNRTAFINKIKVANNGDVFVATAKGNSNIVADKNGIFVLNAANTTFNLLVGGLGGGIFIGTDANSIGFDIERSVNGDMWFSGLDKPTSPTQRALYRARWDISVNKWDLFHKYQI